MGFGIRCGTRVGHPPHHFRMRDWGGSGSTRKVTPKVERSDFRIGFRIRGGDFRPRISNSDKHKYHTMQDSSYFLYTGSKCGDCCPGFTNWMLEVGFPAGGISENQRGGISGKPPTCSKNQRAQRWSSNEQHGEITALHKHIEHTAAIGSKRELMEANTIAIEDRFLFGDNDV